MTPVHTVTFSKKLTADCFGENCFWKRIRRPEAAFLKGTRFEDLERDYGKKRPPCAFTPDEELWELLLESDPSLQETMLGHALSDFCFEMLVAAYGLKDAVLLWHLAFDVWHVAFDVTWNGSADSHSVRGPIHVTSNVKCYVLRCHEIIWNSH